MIIFTAVVITLMLCDMAEYRKSKSDTAVYLILAVSVLTGAWLYYA